MGKPSIETPDVPDDWRDIKAADKPEVGEYYLPGAGRTYLNPEFAGKVADLIQRARNQGISLQFSSGYRTQAGQDELKNDPTAITPARHSLHSAGRSVDVSNWSKLGTDAQNKVLEAAKAAGLDWGGRFRRPDRPHFYSDPGTDRQRLIDSFAQSIAAFRSQIPDR
ncbi:MAG TPA: M15 family metallopeptidase [Rhizomicrobium sp.]|nr:M15 family metallopeptidase [Rhizomicrobium sp.]